MSIIRSMSIGAAGLRAHTEALSAVGDNIANVNTVGYKRERAVFEDVLGRSVAGGSAIAMSGSGSRLAHVENMWSQGAMMTTDAPTDLAVSGEGLFVVNGNVDGVNGNFYTRAGQFHIDEEGFLVNPDDLRLQGYPADEAGVLSSTLGDLRVSGTTLPATATTSVDMAVSLDANATVIAAPWDPANPSTTSNFATSVTNYDSLGNPHDTTVYFRKTAVGWDWHAMVDGGEIAPGGTAGVPFEGASGSLTFGTDGALTSDTTAASSWNFRGATAGQAIAFDFGTSTVEGGTGFDGSTGLAGTSHVVALAQDGFAGGSVSGIRVEADGTVTGVFSNGQLRTLGAVALADFTSESGLARTGHNLWSETRASGEPLVGAAGAGGMGAIVSGALEGSNVDLGAEFVELIAFQRGFSANSRIITTADEMYQELVSLKR